MDAAASMPYSPYDLFSASSDAAGASPGVFARLKRATGFRSSSSTRRAPPRRAKQRTNQILRCSLLDGVEATHTLMLSDCSIMRASRRWRRVRESRLR